jgi:hypothetical protein
MTEFEQLEEYNRQFNDDARMRNRAIPQQSPLMPGWVLSDSTPMYSAFYYNLL